MRSALLFCGLLLAGLALSGTDDFGRMRQNVTEYALANAAAPSPEQVKAVLGKIRSDGSIDGVDYGNYSKILEHVNALNTLALAYSKPGGALYRSEELKQAFFRLSDYWVTTNPWRGVSWYADQIGIPTKLATGVIPFYDAMKRERPDLIPQWGKQIATCERSIERHLGANLVDVSYASLCLAALIEDSKRVHKVLRRLDEKSFQYSHGATEGLHVDASYSSHNYGGGRQAYDGGYGVSFLTGGARVLQIINGTEFKLASDSVSRFASYLLDGFQWKCYRGFIDPQVSGRRVYLSGRYRAPEALVKDIAAALPVRRDEAKRFADSFDGKAPEITGNRMFYLTDMMVHRGKDFYFSVRMSSTRTIRSEGHGQWFSADGAYVALVRGDEYDGVFAAGDLFAIPGTTETYLEKSAYEVPTERFTELEAACNAVKKDVQARLKAIREFKQKYSRHISPDATKQEDLCIKIEDFGPEFGSSRTAGGVSDGEAGLCAMEFSRNGASALKAWFFPGDYIVALGAGITGASEKHPVRTTVNQCRANGPVSTGKNWVHHDNIGMVFSGGEKVSTAVEKRENELFRLKEWPWAQYDFKLDRTKASAEIMSCRIEHGDRPKNASYAYAVVPNLDAAETGRFAEAPPFRVLENSTEIQAIEAENFLGAVFYRSGKITGKNQTIEIRCASPVAVLVRRGADGNTMISAADLELRSGSKIFCDYTGADGVKHQCELDLPKDEYAGSTFSIIIGKQK